MRIGLIGCGRLGISMALRLSQHGGHNLLAFDTDPDRMRLDADRGFPSAVQAMVEQSAQVEFTSPNAVVNVDGRVVLVAVPPALVGDVLVDIARRAAHPLVAVVVWPCDADAFDLAGTIAALPWDDTVGVAFHPILALDAGKVLDAGAADATVIGCDRALARQRLVEAFAGLASRPRLVTMAEAQVAARIYNRLAQDHDDTIGTAIALCGQLNADPANVRKCLAGAVRGLWSPKILEALT